MRFCDSAIARSCDAISRAFAAAAASVAESLAIARHKANYYIDLSGWAPKYFPAELVHNINTLLQDKALFGSDWPAIGVERWLEEFQQVNMKPEVRKKIMLDNAVKFFGLTL